jgi:hypothetical protein
VSDDNTASKNYYKRIAQELAEFDTPQARHQAVLDRHWEAMREQDEPDDQYLLAASRNSTRRRQAFTRPGAIAIGACVNGPSVLAAAVRRD